MSSVSGKAESNLQLTIVALYVYSDGAVSCCAAARAVDITALLHGCS